MSERRKNLFSPPHAAEAEKAIIGAILNDPSKFNSILDLTSLEPDHFFVDNYRLIFQAMIELDAAGHEAEMVSLYDKATSLGAKGISMDYFIELTASGFHTQSFEYYGTLIKDKYYLRQIITSCQSTIQKALNFEGSAQSLVEDVEKSFLALAQDKDRNGGLFNAKQVLIPTLEELERRINADGMITGVTSGFPDLDNFTSGWQRSDLVILAARPGMGKTALALNFAMNAIKSGNETKAAIFTLEMSKEQLMERLLSSESRIDTIRMRKGDLDGEDQDRLMLGARNINDLGERLVIDETPGISLSQLRSRCRRYQKEHGLDLIVIDYLQLMTASATSQKQGREREIGEISMGLKSLAKELAVPIIALAQLNRGPDARPDKRPKISDLRESGSMEQDADMILFVYRDDYYNPNSEHAGKAEVLVAKNRHGETGSVYLAWLPNFVSFHGLMKEG